MTSPLPGSGGVVLSKITLNNATISGYVNHVLGSARQSTKSVSELEDLQFTFQTIEYTNLFGSKSATDDWASPA